MLISLSLLLCCFLIKHASLSLRGTCCPGNHTRVKWRQAWCKHTYTHRPGWALVGSLNNWLSLRASHVSRGPACLRVLSFCFQVTSSIWPLTSSLHADDVAAAISHCKGIQPKINESWTKTEALLPEAKLQLGAEWIPLAEMNLRLCGCNQYAVYYSVENRRVLSFWPPWF